MNGVSATYVWVYARPQKTAVTRMFFYGSFMGMAAVVGSALSRPDVVIGSSPPLPVGVAAAAVARRYGTPWLLDVRDLWPEAAVAMGELSNPRLVTGADRLALKLYEDASVITVTTESFRSHISERVISPDKIHVLPNGTTDFWLATSRLFPVPTRTDLGLESDRFLWTFAGNVGGAQGLEAAVDAARRLGEGFQLLILGDGPARRGLEERARGMLGSQVLFRGQVPENTARKYLAVSDALLVTLGAHAALSAFVPSKLFDFCATGKPVVLAASGEPVGLAGRTGAALCVPPGDPDALASELLRLRSDGALREQLSEAGPRFARANLRSRQVERLDAILQALDVRRQ
jgi:glycosyltransferase involved in cell wall biosynthesis